MVLKDLFAPFQNLFSVIDIFLQAGQLVVFQGEQVGVGLYQFEEIRMVLGGSSQELELRVVFLSLAEGHQEVASILGRVLCCVLNDGLLPFRQFFGDFCGVLIGFGLLQLEEDTVQEGCLLRRLFLLYGLGLRWLGLRWLWRWLLYFDFLLDLF